MKYWIIFALILIATATASGQTTFDYQASDEYMGTNETTLMSLSVSLKNGNILVVEDSITGFKLKQTWTVYNENLEILKEIESSEKHIYGLVANEKGVFAFYGIRDNLDVSGIYLATLNEDTFALAAIKTLSPLEKKKRSFVSIKFSNNYSKVMVFESYKRKSERFYNLFVLDSGLNELWKNELSEKEFLVENESFDVLYFYNKIIVANNGSVYVPGIKFVGKRLYNSPKNKFNGISVKRFFKNEKISSYDLAFNDNERIIPNNFKMLENLENSNIRLVLLRRYGKIRFQLELMVLTDQLNLVNKSNIEPSIDSFLELTAKEKTTKKWLEKLQANTFLKDVLVFPNNNIIVVTEQNKDREGSTSGNLWSGYSVVSGTTRRGNIIFYNFNNKNELIWANILKKNQKGPDSGFSVSKMDDSLYFIFNDTDKNYLNTEERTPLFSTKYITNSLSGNILKAVKLDTEIGNTEEVIVFNLDKINVWPQIGGSIITVKDNMFFLGKKNRKFKLMKLYLSK